MTLLFLSLLLVGPYLLLTPAARLTPGFKTEPATRARVGLSLFFVFAAAGHFLRAGEMSEMLPPAVPYRLEIVYLTGLLELAGAAGVWVPRLRRLTGLCLILMLVCFLPANVYSALNRVELGGHGGGPAYLLVRVPFQLFVIWWAYYATGQRWFAGRAPRGTRRRAA